MGAHAGEAATAGGDTTTVEHLVLLKFKPETTPPQRDALLAALRGLPEKVPGIMTFHCGPNFSPSRAQGFDIGIHVQFPSREALAAYGPHPEHQTVLAQITALCADLIAVDFDA